jgi:UvrB/uvrC motif
MSRDFDALLRDWEFKPGMVQARLVRTRTGREVIQVRVDLGMMQIETAGRPDGTQPHGFPTYFDYLQSLAEKAERADREFTLSEEQSEEADREFTQFYHRRIAWLTLRAFDKAIADADHTLAFMDFIRDHAPNDEYRLAHEQYRGFVLFHRTQAAAASAVEAEDPEKAVDAILTGLRQIRSFFAEHDLEEQTEEDGMVRQLRKLEKSLREMHGIEETLQEQLDTAIANEEYERAARLRDALRQKHSTA